MRFPSFNQPVKEALQQSTQRLSQRQITNSQINAEMLLAKVMGMNRVELYLNAEQCLTLEQENEFEKLLERRGSHEPLQYLLGETEFMSLPFKVSPAGLIPRPETELLVELILEKCAASTHYNILDIGTGTGCIAISLAHYLSNVNIVACDVDSAALQLARANAKLNGVSTKINFIELDVFCADFSELTGGLFDVIVSNPPYISLDEFKQLAPEVGRFEPRGALCDNGDGLSFYRCFSHLSQKMLSTEGSLFVEIGATQGKSVRALFEESFLETKIYKDLNQHDRVVIGSRLKNQTEWRSAR